ncbi:MAG: Fur family transcriptional regulator [Alphaproteobacteria bacterium]|jgi:Fur family iron response transcriptional regulator|nr:Fur family transcriptional regulator [Alphaproteobacteria bacterium]MDP6516268.1 Fur family transcriptional regulator [Alphaproteobacteria bacterium]|tara:strand:+ start:653 stop:1078 length:426 start_codon:yes stop_codon:yes gene_type:complete
MLGGPPNPEIRRTLKAAGLRSTRQRHALASVLLRHGNRHVTAETLHAEVRAEGVKVSLATVYNTLHSFTRAGLLRELMVESGPSYFDTNTTPHHHFLDQRTGVLTDIPNGRLRVTGIPSPPESGEIAGVEVIVRVHSGGPE